MTDSPAVLKVFNHVRNVVQHAAGDYLYSKILYVDTDGASNMNERLKGAVLRLIKKRCLGFFVCDVCRTSWTWSYSTRNS